MFSLSASIGYVVERKSRRAGIAFATAGSLLGLVLAVNYFEEVPGIIVGASFAAFAGFIFLAAFEVARKEAAKKVNPPKG
jgi:hypothetical protein